MRKRLLAAGAVMALAAATVMAAEIDYSDFDDSLMRSMDDAIKDLDSNLGGQDASASLANAQVLREGLTWAEKYFANKPETPLGAGYAREAQQHLGAIVASIEARDFDAATGNVRAVVRTCKACHEAYKPPE
jgi:cytochrome c556